MLQPEDGKYKHGKFLFITDVEARCGFAVKNEAFCQILDEVALDVLRPMPRKPSFPAAVEFCNTELLGTLGSCILDRRGHEEGASSKLLAQAVTDMEYGGIAVNTMPPFIFLSPYLTWGGNEEGKEFVSGHGNFGNLLCYDNVEKSIIYANFTSPGHMLMTNKQVFDNLGANMARFSLAPTWMNLTKLMAGAIVGGFKQKDF